MTLRIPVRTDPSARDGSDHRRGHGLVGGDITHVRTEAGMQGENREPSLVHAGTPLVRGH